MFRNFRIWLAKKLLPANLVIVGKVTLGLLSEEDRYRVSQKIYERDRAFQEIYDALVKAWGTGESEEALRRRQLNTPSVLRFPEIASD